MKVYQSKMTEKEVAIISKKYSTSLTTALFVVVSFAIALIVINYEIKKSWGRFFLNCVTGFIWIINFFEVIQLLFFNPIRKDIQERLKIKVKLIVLKKERYVTEDLLDSCTITFKDNPFLISSRVSGSDYHFIKKGDRVDLEMSKYGKWVIKMKHNGCNIGIEN